MALKVLVIVSPRKRVTAQAAASLVGEDTAGAGEKQPEEQVYRPSLLEYTKQHIFQYLSMKTYACTEVASLLSALLGTYTHCHVHMMTSW